MSDISDVMALSDWSTHHRGQTHVMEKLFREYEDTRQMFARKRSMAENARGLNAPDWHYLHIASAQRSAFFAYCQ
jgi:hypothetical protein